MLLEVLATTIASAVSLISTPLQSPRFWALEPFSRETTLEYLESIGEPIATWDYIISAESNWNIYAKNPSSAAYGLYQIMPDTARELCNANYLASWYTQTQCAINIRNAQGFEAWSVY